MTAIVGIISISPDVSCPSIVKRSLLELDFWDSTAVGIWQNDSVSFGNLVLQTTDESLDEKIPNYYPDYNCAIASNARIDYREELAYLLDIDLHNNRVSDSYLILRSYINWGRDCVKHLYGDFSFAIWDSNKNELFCARDHFGCRPFYYYDHKDFFMFSSDIKAFELLKNFTLEISEGAVVDSICSIPISNNSTAFISLKQLEPASYLCYSLTSKSKVYKYWRLQINSKYSKLDEIEAIAGLREHFFNAVKQRCRSITPIGVELSGGIDSSSIYASAIGDVDNQFKKIYAFTHASPQNMRTNSSEIKDEREFAEAVGSLNEPELHHILSAEDAGSFNCLEDALIITKKPIVSIFALLSDVIYKQAKDLGIKVMLSGLGGDQGVTSHGAGYYEELINRKQIASLKEHLKLLAKKKKKNYYLLLWTAYMRISFPWSIRILKILKSRKKWQRDRFKRFAINSVLDIKYNLYNKYVGRMKLPDDNDVRLRQRRRVTNNYITERIENTYMFSQAQSIEYRYPFLDVKLLEYYYSLNTDYKYDRRIFREAMKDILPEKIRLRNDKTAQTIPSVIHRIVKDESQYRSLLEMAMMSFSFQYVDCNKLMLMLDHFKGQAPKGTPEFGPIEFLSGISVLILQKWQREGKIDIGIKC